MQDEATSVVMPRLEGVELKELFATQRDYIDFFFQTIDFEEAEAFFQELISCRGVIVLAGVGKSGIIAQKIATTLVSTGTRALSLSPTDALHGDLGIVSDRDVLVLLSKSGESDELLNLIPSVRNKGARILAMVSNRESRLAKGVDRFVNLPLTKELCPFDLVPTTSAVLQLIFGDVLAVALMKAKGFSLDQYASNHPSGRIGRRITLRVKELMLTGDALPLCAPEATLGASLVEFSDKRCGCLVVVGKKKQLLGIFTDGDLRRSLQKHQQDVLEASIGELMSYSPRYIAADLLAWEAVKMMEADQKHPITVLPVVEEGQVVGLIKMHDLIQAGL